jgi:hypothetical protein
MTIVPKRSEEIAFVDRHDPRDDWPEEAQRLRDELDAVHARPWHDHCRRRVARNRFPRPRRNSRSRHSSAL